MTSTRVGILEASQKFNLPKVEQHADAQKMWEPHTLKGHEFLPQFGGGTESGPNTPMFTYLPSTANLAGYECHVGPSESFVFMQKGFAEVLDVDFHLVVPGQGGPASKGGHGKRGLMFIIMKHDALGVIAYGQTHFPTDHPSHKGQQEEVAQACVEFMKNHAEGPRICFLGADTNRNDRKIKNVYGPGVTTCWDEINYHPATHGSLKHGGTIDNIASWDEDGRVKCHDADVLLHPRSKSDHRPVGAWYDITHLAAA